MNTLLLAGRSSVLARIGLFGSLLLLASPLWGQVGIGTTTPKAALQVTSPNSGVLIPNYATLAEANTNSLPTLNATDHKGLMIYVDEAANRGFWFYDGSGFVKVGAQPGALPIASGGSGQTTANAALNALLPAQSSNAGKLLTTDGTSASWQKPASRTRSIILDIGRIDVSAEQNNGSPPTKAPFDNGRQTGISFADRKLQLLINEIPMPADWNGITPITITLYYITASEFGNYEVNVAARLIGLNSWVNGAATSLSSLPVPATTSLLHLSKVTYTLDVNNATTDSILQLRVQRQGDAPSDTGGGNFILLGIRIDYQD